MTAVEAEWSPVTRVVLGEDRQVRMYADASLWLKKIEVFRKGEDERMFQQQPSSEDLEVHKSLLHRLIEDGNQLLSTIHQIGLPENLEGITTESVRATMDLLRADYRGWHEPMSAERRAEILKQAFPDVA